MSEKELRQMFEKGYIKGDNLYKLALYKGWNEEQVQRIVEVIDKYAQLESVNENYAFLTQKKYNPLDFRNDLRQAGGIRDDEDIFLILKALCERDMSKYNYFAQTYFPQEQWNNERL